MDNEKVTFLFFSSSSKVYNTLAMKPCWIASHCHIGIFKIVKRECLPERTKSYLFQIRDNENIIAMQFDRLRFGSVLQNQKN
jgi:hypothetical protein